MEQTTSTSRTPVVLCQKLTKVFSDFWMRAQVRAVDTFDLEIHPGEVFGLIGPNGSGKSTTIKMILGLLHKTSGRIAVFGKPPTDIGVKKRIGYLPEESYLYPFLNSRETLDFYAKLFGYERRVRGRRIDELLDMVGLEAVQYRPIGQFSKGMQRRIGIAQALINDPDFLILDEPTSGLDPLGIRQVKDLIIDLGRRGKTILLSSHMLADVEDVCDRMVILFGGKKRAEGTRDELLTEHARTVIETDTLNEEQLAVVSRFIEQESGKHVHKAAPARQSLESLFLKIVEQAQAEHIVTHGATSGGRTAAFLRGEGDAAEKVEGADLIADLLSEDEPTPQSAEPVAQTSPDPSSVTEEPEDEADRVLKSLLNKDSRESDGGATSPQPASTGTAGQSKPTSQSQPGGDAEDFDRSVIDSLLKDDGNDEPSRGEKP